MVCIRPGEEALGAELATTGVTTLCCPNAAAGMGHTLADAISQLPRWNRVVVALADMPAVRPGTYRALAKAGTDNEITRPVYQGRAGNPVAFGARWFAQLARCRGDRGARSVLTANPEQVQDLEVDDPGIHLDIDSPEDLMRFQAAEAGCADSR
jgi:molybdenum cofactor cytidylyltransferase